ncbi:MAG: hypothetical protein HY275_08175, partial [Gemmatimonadetes bacterium]|nr:hypothetical protein [Gemmatimonadota bacterium]
AAAPKPTLESLEGAKQLPAGALAAFKGFASSAGMAVPADADEARLTRTLLVALANAIAGDKGLYRMRALLDPEVEQAVGALGRATELLAARK